MLIYRGLHFFNADWATPFIINHHNFGPTTHSVIAHPLTKHPIAANNHFIARLDEVNKTGFHTRTTRRRNGNRKFVFRLESIFQELFQLIHHTDK
ncbi:Uncharacterised protein [Vibrio cholerae]|nr:Uncharacterised protein [Vibrio cholerae]CSC00603.1 Uncharacterised protein [Vibrio cholerae]